MQPRFGLPCKKLALLFQSSAPGIPRPSDLGTAASHQPASKKNPNQASCPHFRLTYRITAAPMTTSTIAVSSRNGITAWRTPRSMAAMIEPYCNDTAPDKNQANCCNIPFRHYDPPSSGNAVFIPVITNCTAMAMSSIPSIRLITRYCRWPTLRMI